MQRTADDPLARADLKKTRRPPGRLCSTCLKRELFPAQAAFDFDAPIGAASPVEIFRLKLRDWLGVERVDLVPCLSVCPKEGITVERRGSTMVLDAKTIELIQKQFDPTRQLSLFDVL